MAEQGAWRDVPQGWRQLYGNFNRLGLSVEWHDFRTPRPLDWGVSFHPQSIEFCLNLGGRGAVGDSRSREDFLPGTSGYYAIADEPLVASRQAHDHHQFVTLEFSRSHLQKQLEDNGADLEPAMRASIFEDRPHVSKPRAMTIEQRKVVASLTEPPVAKAAQVLWYQSKALELMAHFLFEPKDPELFCMRQKRVARDRVERAKQVLAHDLANPPALEQLGVLLGEGKPLADAQYELGGTAHWLSAQATLDLPVVVNEDTAERHSETRRVPLGVVAALSPWNFPVLLAYWKVLPALLAGNTVVLKPSPFTPLTALKIGELAREFLPPGVLNVVSGGDALGPMVTGHPGINKIAFTGSTETGKRVLMSAAAGLKKVTLELGGNDPAIVLPDVMMPNVLEES